MSEMESGGADSSPDQVRPWGAWATIGWSILVYIAANLVSLVLIGIYLGYTLLARNLSNLQTNIIHIAYENGGDIIWVSAIISGMLISLSIIGLAYFRRYPLKEYFGFVPFSVQNALGFSALLIIFYVSWTIFAVSINYTADQQVFGRLLESTTLLPLFIIAICIIAPISEELLFRGFILTGLRKSWLGDVGAVIACAVLWGIIHFQYDWIAVANIIVLGGLLGYARLKSGSLYLSMVIHAINNGIAAAELLYITGIISS